MSRRITIDPITRLEGHGKIEIFVDDAGHVDHAYLQVPEFKGFEKFCEGRAVEEMPTLTQKICGVCPTAHHTASSKALDAMFDVEPPITAKKLRELAYCAFVFEDHLLHFFFLGGPDLIVGPDSPSAKRNILGVVEKVGEELGKQMIDIRKRVRNLSGIITGSALFPVFGLPGGISKGITEETRQDFKAVSKDAVDFAVLILRLFTEDILKREGYFDLLMNEDYYSRTYYMGLVDEENRLNFYDGRLRIVDPVGNEFVKFEAENYLDHLAEQVEPWSYMKNLFLKDVGWKGYQDGFESGIYRVGPLARLNVSDRLSTPLANEAFDRMYHVLGGKPAHHTLAYHWARLIEILHAAEKMGELAEDEDLIGTEIRTLPEEPLNRGVGVCEAPRGTLFHDYHATKEGIIEKINLIVATQNSAAAIALSVAKAARAFVKEGMISENDLNMVEMAFRAYDPCLACATH